MGEVHGPGGQARTIPGARDYRISWSRDPRITQRLGDPERGRLDLRRVIDDALVASYLEFPTSAGLHLEMGVADADDIPALTLLIGTWSTRWEFIASGANGVAGRPKIT